MPLENEIPILPVSRSEDVECQQLQSKQASLEEGPSSVNMHDTERPFDVLPPQLRFLTAITFINKMLSFLRGPRPPASVNLKTWKWQLGTEARLLRWTRPIARFKFYLIPLLLAVWIVAVALLVRESWFTTSNTLVGTGSSFWAPNAQCGLDGTNCEPFYNSTLAFRCPSNPLIKLLNPRTIGNQEINLKTLLVGGGDQEATYRADSWICAAAYQQGLISNTWGGCGIATQIGSFTDFQALTKNGLTSIAFDTVFPSAYRLSADPNAPHCKDLKYPILVFNVCLLWLFSILLRPKAALFFWVSFCVGFWQIAVTLSPPSFSDAFGTFLPALFMGYAFYRASYRFLLPSFDSLLLERSILFLGPFWVGIMMDRTIETWVNVDRFTASDINKTGTLPAVIVIAILLLIVVINQFRVMRSTGWLLYYLVWYVCAGIALGVMAALPGLTLRIHHYILAILLIPLVAFPTRLSLIMGAFLLGMFLNGAAIWSFDSILQTAAELRRDAALGSDLPSFTTTSPVSPLSNITWSAIPANLTASWDGFGLIIDDVLRWQGNSSVTSYNISTLNSSLTHYFRIGYQSSGTFGDFTKAATLFTNGTWLSPSPGAG